MVNILNLLVGD